MIVNRTRLASMILTGETLLLAEMTPALFATVAANEAEKASPEITLVDVQMIVAAGRVFISGEKAAVEAARDSIVAFLEAIPGRDQ